jgi:predicted  nucleic acid-binding Zn-ribbon protein
MFHCENCGKKFKTAAAAQHAIDSGCPKCSGSDIYPSDQEPYTCPAVRRVGAVQRQRLPLLRGPGAVVTFNPVS